MSVDHINTIKAIREDRDPYDKKIDQKILENLDSYTAPEDRYFGRLPGQKSIVDMARKYRHWALVKGNKISVAGNMVGRSPKQVERMFVSMFRQGHADKIAFNDIPFQNRQLTGKEPAVITVKPMELNFTASDKSQDKRNGIREMGRMVSTELRKRDWPQLWPWIRDAVSFVMLGDRHFRGDTVNTSKKNISFILKNAAQRAEDEYDPRIDNQMFDGALKKEMELAKRGVEAAIVQNKAHPLS